MPGAALTNFLQLFISGACIAGAVKLWRSGLSKKYRALTSFLLFFCLYTLSILIFFRGLNSPAYRIYWYATQPLTWLLSVWLVLELYSLILEKHKGLATLGRWAQYVGFSLATLISFLVMMPEIRAGGHGSKAIFAYYYAVERGVDCGMLVFLIVILFWLTQYPVPLSRNVILHSFVYTILFFADSLGLFARVFFGKQLWYSASNTLTVVFALCILAWLLFLTPKGEEIRLRLLQFSADDEERVLAQLESLNRTLLRVSRR
ncbi:MAG TPA: hypothetical protein VH640_28000 [Bryobacteraceae bacterium]|jgi:hypothetical protein